MNAPDRDSALPSREDILAVRVRLARIARRTPVLPSAILSRILGAPVFLKCENFQRTGSYKIRGAYNRLSRLGRREREAGVVAASAGNHAQGVALAARELGVRATVFMPEDVALPKLQATTAYGAKVVLHGMDIRESLTAAADFSRETGTTMIHPYDHPDIIAGQASVGLELLEQIPDISTIICPVGGGGLLSGIATAVLRAPFPKQRSIRLIGVQSQHAAGYPASLTAGYPVAVPPQPTIADGIAVAKPGNLNFSILRDALAQWVLVDDDDISRAIVLLIERAKLTVEPAGAAAVAAILAGLVRCDGTTAVVLSGGNIDPLILMRTLDHGLTSSGRHFRIQMTIPDRPGQLAEATRIVAAQGANVLEVLHSRHERGLQTGEIMLKMEVETRGPEHAEGLHQALEGAGFHPSTKP